jgi:Flp pilus assembly protein TadG
MMRKRQTGQALVAVTFGLVVLLGAAGLAIDMGYLRYQKRLQQSAADSAALAAAGDLAYVPGLDINTSATNEVALNGFTGGGVTVKVNNPPATGPFVATATAGNKQYVEVLITVVQPTFFMKIFGVNTVNITARAVALAAGKNCVYSLGTTTGITPPPPLFPKPPCGVIDHLVLVGQGAVPAADPLAYLTAPPIPTGCADGTVNGSKPPNPPPPIVTLTSGCYTRIAVTGNASVQLNGTYIVTGVDGITFNGTGSLIGSDVTFYLGPTAGPVSISRPVNLVAPTAGPYAGILFYQDPGNANAATITGTGGSTLQGALYFPSATLSLTDTGTGAAYTIAVANSLVLGGTTNFPADYSSLPGGSPIKAAVLVE